MSFSAFAFLVDDAAKSIRRNGLMSIAALTTVTVAMAVLGGSLFTIYRLKQFADSQPRRFEILAFVEPKADAAAVESVRDRATRIPGVAAVRVYTKDQALRDLQAEDRRQHTEIVASLEGINPLPDRIDVRVSDPAVTVRVANELRSPRFPEIEQVRDENDALSKLIALSNVIRNVGGAVAVLLFIATAFVIQNTIRLTIYARRREIRVMQLVGATSAFIRLPFLLEGTFYGAAGATAAACLVLFVVSQVSIYVRQFQTPLTQGVPPAVSSGVIVVMMVTTGAAVGIATSVISLRRFLRKV
jgi:cell division transport system permease protein